MPQSWIEQVMRAESGGNPEAVSPVGAMGLMQLMPGTWAEMRAELKLGSDRFSPRDNILAGTWYLKLMHQRFGYPGLFAAYNAGPKRYGDYLAGRAALPSETRAYLASVTGAGGAAPPPVPPASEVARSPIFFTLSKN